MKTNLHFDFTVDKHQRTITVTREFDAGLARVWAAWTQAELLDKWWAPKPYRTQTKSMDFRTGGQWLYAMISPENEKHWSCVDYRSVAPQQRFSGIDAFCDENGNINQDLPRALWTNSFEANQGTTTVRIEITYDDLADLEKIIAMGFKEGFTMGLQNLDELLESTR